MSNDSKRIDPIQNLFQDVTKILEFIEIKDAVEAEKYDTPEIKNKAAMWVNAKLEKDSFITYREYWEYSMFQEISSTITYREYKKYLETPFAVPMLYRDNVLQKSRKIFLSQYEEKNDYYRILNGLPPIDTPESEFVYLSEPMRNQLHASKDPIHLLSPLIQNNFMSTPEYKELVANNPDKTYLKYLGLYKIDTFTARSAKDFEIIRYVLNRSDINPNLIDIFSGLYADYREYVMSVLYNKNLESVYVGYREFMGSLIMMFTLMQIPNKAVESISNKKFLDDSILHIILQSYDIDNSLLLTNEVRRNLVINMLKLIKEKGTNDVYYDLIEILGYQDIIISKLMLMKGQKFDKDDNYKVTGEVEPYFLQLDLKDNNPYDTISKGEAPIHDYHSIIDNDPTWWDDFDTRKILETGNYSMTNSKYIMIEAVIHQMEYLFESIYFSRMILDNKSATNTFMIEIPELLGTEPVSIYDLTVFLLAALCMNNGLSGEIVTQESKLLATAGFNFNMNFDTFTEFLNTTKYVDVDRVMKYLSNLTVMDMPDINRLFNEVLYPMREWLEYKITNASNRHEYVEYESIYRALYTYDITHNTFFDNFELPLTTICKRYDISTNEMIAYQHFYPRTYTGEAITFEELPNSKYYGSFLKEGYEVPYFIHIKYETESGEKDRGYLFFHDILNCDDLRELKQFHPNYPREDRVFMDYNDGEKGWEVDPKALETALRLIDNLDDDALVNAYFKIDTPEWSPTGTTGKIFKADEKLPTVIRSKIYKEILKEKIQMDLSGFASPPSTYQEYLYRNNRSLYNILMKDNRFNINRSAWLDDVTKIILAVETELNLHMKYFEQAIVGQETFFKPLISLIDHFKSAFVDIAKTGLKFVFDDKIDAGGNSNMLRLFDEVEFIINFVILQNKGYGSEIRLFDTWHKGLIKIEMNDRSEILRMTSEGFDAQVREETMGSLRLVDEAKFFLNGKPLDPNGYSSVWFTGEPGTGRWTEEDEILMRARKETVKVQNKKVDLDGWKDYVESYVFK